MSEVVNWLYVFNQSIYSFSCFGFQLTCGLPITLGGGLCFLGHWNKNSNW